MDVSAITALAQRVPPKAFDDVVRQLYRDAAGGRITLEEASAVHEAIEARRMATKDAPRPMRRPSLFPVRKPQRPRAPGEVVARRRRVAASGALPPSIAALFTPAETAALAIVAAEVRRHGRCELALDVIAAIAGCSRSTVKNALRSAVVHGLVAVSVRPVRGAKNRTNVVTIVDPAWSAWLRRPGSTGWGQTANPHGYPLILKGTEPTKRDACSGERASWLLRLARREGGRGTRHCLCLT